MKAVKVREVMIGEGMPKICVPIVGVTKEEILKEAATVKSAGGDIAEWRADWYENGCDAASDRMILKELREVLGKMPILFTFRTKKEGGEKEITEEAYEELLEQVSASKEADLIDAELFCGDERMKRIVKKAHENEVFVVASNHDFFKTPAKEEIIGRLKKMQELDADIAKIAVMPQSRQDVLVLLDATREMYETYARGPIVTMSMGQMGAVSRIAGEVFGSSITFGAAGKASAPGQIEVGALRNALLTLHGGL